MRKVEYGIGGRDEKITGMLFYHWYEHFPSLWSIGRRIPIFIMPFLSKLTTGLPFTIMWDRQNLRQHLRWYDPMTSKCPHRVILPELYNGDLPEYEKTPERIVHEDVAILGAGRETVSNTFVTAFYYLCLQQQTHSRLKQELEGSMPNAKEVPSLMDLEKLPYLTAVIKEALRLSYGSTSRFIRVNPHSKLNYGDYVFPPGTTVSMSAMLLCEHPDVYENPKDFWPER